MINQQFNKNGELGDLNNIHHIYLGKAGSHSYGTNTATSDEDFRGIFVASKEFLTTPFYSRNEYRDPSQKDHVSYEVAKFIKLYTQGNPNIVELLWTDDNDILYRTPEYDLLRQHRLELLSTNVAFSFSGYALSQLKAMKSQNKWENNPQSIEPPRQIDYVKLVVNFTPDKLFSINLEDFHKNHRLVHYGGHIYGLYNEQGYSPFNDKNFNLNVNSDEFEHTTSNGERKTPLHIVKFNIEEYKRDLEVWSNYWAWRNLKNKKIQLFTLIQNELLTRDTDVNDLIDTDIHTVVEQENMAEFIKTVKTSTLNELLHLCKRHFDFSEVGADMKHGMHLVRLLRMGVEVLRDGVINVKRPDAKELLEIRNGAWTYEQLIEYGEEQNRLIKELYAPKSVLNKKPNVKLAAKLLLDIQNKVWY